MNTQAIHEEVVSQEGIMLPGGNFNAARDQVKTDISGGGADCVPAAIGGQQQPPDLSKELLIGSVAEIGHDNDSAHFGGFTAALAADTEEESSDILIKDGDFIVAVNDDTMATGPDLLHMLDSSGHVQSDPMQFINQEHVE